MKTKSLEQANLTLLGVLIDEVIQSNDWVTSTVNYRLHKAVCELAKFMNNETSEDNTND